MDGTLKFNVVDSLSNRGYSRLLPLEIIDINTRSEVDETYWLAYVISPGKPDVCGELHVDPAYGSGWQYLIEGVKRWFVIHDSTFDLKAYQSTADAAAPPNMEALAEKYKVYSAVIEAGDWISCPENFPHAVVTLEKSLGLSGYSEARR